MEHISDKQLIKPIKRIDKLVSYIINHAYIKTSVFIVAFLEGIILPFVPEIVVATVLTYRKDISWKLLSLISALGSISGLTVLYLLGKFLYKTNEIYFDTFLDNGGRVATYAQDILSQNTFIAMFLACFTPLPDRLLAFLSGVLSMSFLIVVSAFFCGRLLRVGIVAYFSYKFGNEARAYILKHTKRATVTIILTFIAYLVYKIACLF